MADKANKFPENVRGRFYVDNQCIGCARCQYDAPEFFGARDDGLSYVKKQPTTEQEIQTCTEEMDYCPVNAIGNDGDQA